MTSRACGTTPVIDQRRSPARRRPVLERARSARRLHPCRGPWRRAACGPTASRHCRRPQRPRSSRRLLVVLRRLRRRPRPCARTASRRCRRRRRPAETLSADAMDCDGRGPAPTAGTDRRPARAPELQQPIDAAGAAATAARCGLVAETATAAPEPAAAAEQTRPWTPTRRHRPRRRRRRHPPRTGPPGRGRAAAERTRATTAGRRRAGRRPPAAGDDAADAKLALAPIAPAAAAEGEEMGAPAYTFLLRRERGRQRVLERGISRALDKAGGGLAPPPDLMPETLPRLAWVCDAAQMGGTMTTRTSSAGPGATRGRVACPRWT